LICPEDAIQEKPHAIGYLESGVTSSGMTFSRGVMHVGEPMSVPIIRQLKKSATIEDDGEKTIIIDAPPGTSCPVVESVRETDYVLLVTEPTPFGLHDLALAVEMVRELDLPAGVIINRDGIGDAQVDAFCEENNLPILMRIPMQREIAEALARGVPLIEAFPAYHTQFAELYRMVREHLRLQENRKGAKEAAR
jgi:MinD superfamily P-loop ATPase